MRKESLSAPFVDPVLSGCGDIIFFPGDPGTEANLPMVGDCQNLHPETSPPVPDFFPYHRIQEYTVHRRTGEKKMKWISLRRCQPGQRQTNEIDGWSFHRKRTIVPTERRCRLEI